MICFSVTHIKDALNIYNYLKKHNTNVLTLHDQGPTPLMPNK